ncbi:zonadhesin [Eupeodes corollae]|uniref:zonadhesin n=1 Tax=Eupeodes corollae TaxID=290404 RepID=UPI00249025DC|nr:zonadhesin [Eupeodes corollae]
MVKLIICLAVIAVCVAVASAAGECPSYTKVQNCTPKCLQDSECSSIGGKCCPNLCNGRSCAQPNVLSNSGSGASGKDKYSSGGSGSYCGNVKCSSFEKCNMDKSTQRPKCVRA